jgi:TPP-dependent pyruvate/acetoin dehydrogenase alpha subunit
MVGEDPYSGESTSNVDKKEIPMDLTKERPVERYRQMLCIRPFEESGSEMVVKGGKGDAEPVCRHV